MVLTLATGRTRADRHDGGMPSRDEVDRIVDAWRRERPDLDFSPLEVLSRVGLSALRRAGDPYQLSPKALLQQTLVSSGTMTNRIDRLVARGLVERRTDPHDGRGILVVMSDAGRTRVDTAITRLVAEEAELLDTMPGADRDVLAGLLRQLILDLDDDGA
jgi:DNA-binding MarR family transcriptional regulator